jgi:transposase
MKVGVSCAIQKQNIRVQLAWVQRNRELINWESKNRGWEQCSPHFFYAKGIIHHEFVSEKQTVNGKFYKEVIKRLIARVHCVRPEFQESWSWYLLHDNAPAHSSGVVSECLTKRGIPVLSHPTYRLDLAPTDFLFPKLKIAMKGTRFETVSSIKQIVTWELKAIWEEAFSWTFNSLYERCKRYVEASVDCVKWWYFFIFFVYFMTSVRELNCRTL